MGVETVEPRTLRVANLIEEGRWGGPQKRITLVAAALKKHAIETTVLLPSWESDRFCQALSNVGVTWRRLSLHRLGRGWRIWLVYMITFVPDIYRLWRELRYGEYDLLHASGGAWQLKGPIAGRLAGIPVIWHLNDTQMPNTLVVLFRRFGNLADGFFVAAKRVHRYYIEGTPLEKISAFTVPAPVSTDEFSHQTTIADESIQAKALPRIVTVSNINPVKGLQTLIKASALLKTKLNIFSVSIVGALHASQKNHFTILTELISKHDLRSIVTFEGDCHHVPSILRGADIYVCSSIAEASPMAVWEAMSMGCAIVSTDVGDVAEYIRNGENGFIVPIGDAHAMAEAIHKLAANEALRHEFGKRAREVACRELDVCVIADRTAKGYSAVIAARRRQAGVIKEKGFL